MQPVKSSNVAAVGYDQSNRILKVRFTNGKLYHYADFPPEKHAALMAADSVGKYLNQHVKGVHAHTLIPEEKKS